MKALAAAMAFALSGTWAPANGQTPYDSLTLPALRAAALASDPRASQLQLLAAQSALRLRNIDAEFLPGISVQSQAQYQSDVASIPINIPGLNVPRPAHDTYDARLEAQQRIYDPTAGARRNLERARAAESGAQVNATLYSLVDAVNSAFFSALRSQEQMADLKTAVTDLEAQLSVADARVEAGTSLASEAKTLRAEILRRQQAVAEQQASKNAAVAILADLTGTQINGAAPLKIPDLQSSTFAARNTLDSLRTRPEYERFARSRDVLSMSDKIRAAEDRPRVVAFGRTGYGRPGLNPLNDSFDTYWLAGVMLQWTPWNWGSTSRERQVSQLQRQILITEETAFTAQLKRATELDVATIDRLERTLASDEEIIALREAILTETRARFAESVITSAEYVDRQTDVLAARINRSLHRVELSQARVHFLTTLGVEVH